MEISVNPPLFCLIFLLEVEQKGGLLYRCEEDLDLV